MTLWWMPFPLIMYHYGAVVRMKCKYSFEAAEMIKKMQMQQTAATADNDKEGA